MMIMTPKMMNYDDDSPTLASILVSSFTALKSLYWIGPLQHLDIFEIINDDYRYDDRSLKNLNLTRIHTAINNIVSHQDHLSIIIHNDALTHLM